MLLGTSFETQKVEDRKVISLDGCKLVLKKQNVWVSQQMRIQHGINKQIKCINHVQGNAGILNKLRHFLLEQAFYGLYCSLVSPYLNYGLLLCSNANNTTLSRVYKLQKHALRIISNSHYISSLKPLFDKYDVLNIFDMYKKEVGIFMYKYRNSMLSQSFDDIFINHQSNHNCDTRNKGDYQLSMQRVNAIVKLVLKYGMNCQIMSKPQTHQVSLRNITHVSLLTI